jgi:hypothetical protein
MPAMRFYRDLFAGKGKKDQGRGDPPSQALPQNTGNAAEETPHQGTHAERTWVHKARLTERTQAGAHDRLAYRHRHGHAQQR